MEMNNELIARAKKTKSSEELMALAKENGEELTKESAKEYFELLNPKTGELSDDELDNVAGGGCYSKDGDPYDHHRHTDDRYHEARHIGNLRNERHLYENASIGMTTTGNRIRRRSHRPLRRLNPNNDRK